MKVLLQDLVSLKFLAVNGRWTNKVEDAMDFGEVTRAVNVVCTRPVGRVRVVLKFLQPSYDVELPPVQSGVSQSWYADSL